MAKTSKVEETTVETAPNIQTMADAEGNTQETAQDIEMVVSGAPLRIDLDNPVNPDEPWFMRQPTDIEYEVAMAVRSAVEGQMWSEKEIKAAKSLPPSDVWLESQKFAIEQTTKTVAELKANSKRTEGQNVLLELNEAYLENLIKPDEYSLAEEIVSRHSGRVFQAYLIPRLLVDEKGKAMFDMTTKEGEESWNVVPRTVRTHLRIPFTRIINLIATAKN